MAYDYDPEDKFGYKDTLPESHPEKVVTGVEFDEEFLKIEQAINNLEETVNGQLDLVTSNMVMGGSYSLVTGLVVKSLKAELVVGQPLPAAIDCPDTFLICIDDGPFGGEDLVRSDWIVSSEEQNVWLPLAYSRQDAVTGPPGEDGVDGKGWTGGSYNPSNGIVTFTSDDGLGFTTTDLRGEDGTHGINGTDGKGWTSGSYDDSTGIITFTSDDGLGFVTTDVRGTNGTDGVKGLGWTGGDYDSNTGVVTFASDDGLGFATEDLRGKGWTSGVYDPNTGIVTFTSDDGLGFVTDDLRGADGSGNVDSINGIQPDANGNVEFVETDPTVPSHVKSISQADINKWNEDGGAVDSVNGKTGTVVLNYTDVGAQVAGSYSLTNHNHSGVYATASHNHSGVYATASHTHSQYAASNHNHSGVYAPINHTHSGTGFSGTYTASTSAVFTMTGSDKSAFTVVSSTSARGCELKLQGASTASTQHLRATDQGFQIVNGAYSSMTFQVDASGHVWAAGDVRAYSDERLKENIEVVGTGLLDQVRGVEFNWKKDGRLSSGVIAQDIQKAFPHLVTEVDSAEMDDKEAALTVNYAGLTAYLIEEIKECRQRIKALEEAV